MFTEHLAFPGRGRVMSAAKTKPSAPVGFTFLGGHRGDAERGARHGAGGRCLYHLSAWVSWALRSVRSWAGVWGAHRPLGALRPWHCTRSARRRCEEEGR